MWFKKLASGRIFHSFVNGLTFPNLEGRIAEVLNYLCHCQNTNSHTRARAHTRTATMYQASELLTRGFPGCVWFHVPVAVATVTNVLKKRSASLVEFKTSFGGPACRFDPWSVRIKSTHHYHPNLLCITPVFSPRFFLCLI